MATTREVHIKPGESRRLNVYVIFVSLAVFLAGITSNFLVKVIGSLPLAELLFLPMMPILLFIQRRQMTRPTIRPVLVLLGVWLLAQIVTDIYRGAVFFDWARGDANVIFFGIDILALVALLGKSESRKVIFLLGVTLGHLLANKLQPLGDSSGWKLGLGPSADIWAVLCICYFLRRRNYPLALLVLISITAINLIENVRSIVLILFITAALTMPIIPERMGRLRFLPRPGTQGRLLVHTVLALGAAVAALGAVKLATNSGLLQQSQEEKNENQSKLPGGILVGGRLATVVAARAVIDSPILGHGSKSRDPKYVEMYADLKARYGNEGTSADTIEGNTGGGIPSHSFLLGTWVSAGVFGGVFWLYLLRPAVKAVVMVPHLQPPLGPLYIYILVTLIWNIFYSPFAALHRVLAALAIVIIAETLETKAPAMTIKSSDRAGRTRRRPITWRAAV